MLVVIPSAVFRAQAADAPCVAASTVCTSWVTLGGGPARSLVYTTRPLDTRSERVTADPALPVLFPKPYPRTHARRVGPVGGGGERSS